MMESNVENFLKKVSTTVTDYIDSKVDLLIDKAFASTENPLKEVVCSAEELFDDLEVSLNVEIEREIGDIKI
ncbi:hypothetical protein JCM21531_4175 [Acetivibrio straminisolvens JCM 21531]|uniref:Uncharacterized protein n=2 Tax=Acetivibrio straminisolvens TaxID=253314 RepID=W4VBI1_9FIRM|nr:hypothetical protein JCM21531_4175 [Acetivibrio straminisolvens JCM 21531]